MATAQSHCYCKQRRSYKQMVRDIADNLGSEDVQQIVFLNDLPSDFCKQPALAALRFLETHGKFSEGETEKLVELLEEIHRFDLIDRHLVQYRKNYCSGGESGQGEPVIVPTHKKNPPRVYSKKPHDITKLHDTSHDITKSHDITNSEHLGSTRLKPEDKRELCNLLQYVPRDVIRRSKIYTFLSSKCHFKSAESLIDSQKIDKDGGCDKQLLSSSVPKGGRHIPSRHDDSTMAFQPPRHNDKGERQKTTKADDDLEWVMLDGRSSDSCTTYSSSGSSMDASCSSLDIDIGDLSIACGSNDKSRKKVKKCNSKERRYFKWLVKRSEFMIPLFQHTNKTFEKRIKLCLGHHDHFLPIIFKLFPNGVGSDENIYASLRIVLPTASQMMQPGTTLVFSITVRDLRSADIIANRHMEVTLEEEEYLLEQFLAHEVIKSSEARHFEITIMTKVNASSRGWVEIHS